MKNLPFNISKTLINKYKDYQNGKYCGKLFEAIHINKTHSDEAGDAALLGQYFEFVCTGAKLRDGSEPLPKTTKTGLSAPYARVLEQKKNFEKLYKDIDYVSNITVEHELNGVNYKGVFDILLKDASAIRDLKYSGLINDKWSEYGWVDIQFKPQILQAKLYIWLIWKKRNKILPFFFDVFSSTNETEFKTIKIEMDLDSLQEFEKELIGITEEIRFDYQIGFECIPEYKLCMNCPLAQTCEQKTELPEVEIIKI